MTRQRKASLLSAVVAIVCVALQFAANIQTGLAGLFIMGMAGGLLIGDEMARDAAKAADAGGPASAA
jgi:hypothetical protein